MQNLDCREEYRLKNNMPNTKEVKNLASFFYAFSDDTRLKIIILLTLKSLCVSDISNVLNLNQTTVSHQLKILKSLNIVEFYRKGKLIIYHIKDGSIERMLNASVECI